MRTLAVIMQRRVSNNRWQSEFWEPWSVLESAEKGPARLLVEQEGIAQWLHPGFELVLHRDETEGYYLNVSSGAPKVFVLWRMDEAQGLPLQVTASYDEGGRWLDGGHSVDGVAMPPGSSRGSANTSRRTTGRSPRSASSRARSSIPRTA